MTEHATPQPRVRTEVQNGSMIGSVEAPFIHDDGWVTITVGWHEDELSNEDGTLSGAWVAHCGEQAGAYGLLGHSRTSQLEALAELVRSIAGLCHMFTHREDELHRVINNSPDALVKELRDAERDLHKVQAYITTHVEPSETDNWDDGLKPLWSAGRALEAFAARIATPMPPERGAVLTENA